MKKPYLIGITGGSASGKTKFIHSFLDQFSQSELCLISQDHYYKEIHEQPKDLSGIENFDTPESLDLKAFQNDLISLLKGNSITRKEYKFNHRNKKAGTITFSPAPIILTEGLFAFYEPETAALYDLKIFIDAQEPTKISRRIIRDTIERGYGLDDVLYRYENHVYPTYRRYIEPLKEEADLIIPNNKSFEKALNVVISHLKAIQ